MDGLKGMVFDIQRYSIHDGPGIRTIVFLKGCPLRCFWCSNPESFNQSKDLVWHSKKCIGCYECISICPEEAINILDNQAITIHRAKCTKCGECVKNCCSNALNFYGKEMLVQEVMDEIRKDVDFYKSSGGGVTLSGGEFTHQYEFALSLLKKCKEEGIHTTVETSGYCEWDKLRHLLKYIDLVLYDLKIFDQHKHKNYTGVSNKLILDNLKKINDLGALHIIRMPLIPTINNNQENAQRMLTFLSTLKSPVTIQILPYHNYGLFKYDLLGIEYTLRHITPPSKVEIDQFMNYFKNPRFIVQYSL